MHRTTTTPSPLNLITTWFMYLLEICKKRGKITRKKNIQNALTNFSKLLNSVKQKKRPSLSQMVDLKTKGRVSARTRMGNKWLSKVKKAQVVPRGIANQNKIINNHYCNLNLMIYRVYVSECSTFKSIRITSELFKLVESH